MKRLTTALLATTVLAFAAGPASADEVKIGIEAAYPPFSAVSADGTFVGFDIDIANALCKEMGAECTLVQQDWDGIIPALLARKYDAMIAATAASNGLTLVTGNVADYADFPGLTVERWHA